ncbi:DMT family transporter [Minwuia sp.]|uniref:DMT family transporter n=1 Tax=Minwuia sp. TaxID=2493630 RepID=UPI003A8ED43E
MKSGGYLASLAMVVVVGLLWGLNWPAVKFMLTELPPITMRAVAFPCAGMLLLLIGRVLGHRMWPAPDERLKLFLVGMFVIFGFNILVTFGQVLSETSTTAIIAFTMPAITAVLSAVFLGEKLDRRIVLAVLIALAGLTVLASEDFGSLIASPLGPLVTLAAATCWAIGNVIQKSRVWAISPIGMAAWFFGIATVLSWPLALALESPWQLPVPTLPVMATMAFHVLGPMILAYMMWMLLLGRLPATVAAISTLLTPVVGVLSAVLLLGDVLTWQKALALALIVASILLTLVRPRTPAL